MTNKKTAAQATEGLNTLETVPYSIRDIHTVQQVFAIDWAGPSAYAQGFVTGFVSDYSGTVLMKQVPGSGSSEAQQGRVTVNPVYTINAGIEVNGVTYFFGTDGDDTLTGTDGVDQMVGGLGNDQLDSGIGDDKLWGEEGDDTLTSLDGNDELAGGEGNDTLSSGAGDDSLWGEDGNDSLDGGAGNDQLIGGPGDDVLIGGEGDDAIWGGEGADQIDAGAGNDKVRGDDGADTIDGNDGDDTIWGDNYSLDDANHGADLITGGAGDDLIAGGGGDDVISGGAGADKIWGDEGGSYGTTFGNDTLNGGDGDDYIMGEGGNDIIHGDAGNDILRGDATYLFDNVHGNDELYGDDGDDKLLGGAGDDLLVGGTGNNEYQFSLGFGNDRITLTEGASDVIQFGSGISRSDVEFIREYNPPPNDPTQGYSDDFTISLPGNGSSIFFPGLFALSYSTVIGEVRFADGTVLLYDEFTNSAPVVANTPGGGSVDTLEDDVFTFNVIDQAVFFDIDNDTLTISLTSPDTSLFDWLSFDGTVMSGTPLNEHVGTYTVNLTANDGYETVDTSFQLTVINTNDAPEVSQPIPSQSATEDTPFSYTVPTSTFIDVDVGDSLSYSASLADGSALPGWLSFNSTTLKFSGTPGNADVGTISVRVTATDLEGASASTDFTLEVLNVNDTPTVSTPVGDVVANEDAAFTYAIPPGTFVDPDAGDTLSYSASQVGGGALPGWLSFDTTSATFSGTPGNDDVGLINIEVTATDSSGSSASTSFSLEVMNTNDAPVYNGGISDLQALEDSPLSYTIPAGTFTDVDAGDTLTYSATANGGALPSWLSINSSTGALSGTPGNSDVGTYAIVVTATDGSGATATASFNLDVSNVNDAPVVDAGIADTSVAQNSAFNYSIPSNAFLDVDGDALTYSATKSDGSALPAWLSFDSTSATFSGTPSASDVGTYTLSVMASDGIETVSTTFTIDVTAVNSPPVVNAGIPNQSATSGTPWTFTIPSDAFSDPDGDTLTFTRVEEQGSTMPLWMNFDWSTGTFTGTPDTADVGSITMLVEVSDGSETAYTTFLLDVLQGNRAPVVDQGIPDWDVNPGTTAMTLIPANAFMDPDGDSLTYTATLANGDPLPSWLEFGGQSFQIPNVPPEAEGVIISVGATDGIETVYTQFTII